MAYFHTNYDASNLMVSVDDAEVTRALGVLGNKTPAALKVAVNTTARQTRKLMLTEVKKRYDLNAAGRTSPTKPFMGPSVRNAPPVFRARVLKDSPMIALGGTSDKSKGFLVQFKSKHIGMVQRQLGIPADKDYTESGKKRWKPNEKLATLSSPSGSAMHHTVWEMQEQTVEQMLQQNTERRVRQLIANAKRKGAI